MMADLDKHKQVCWPWYHCPTPHATCIQARALTIPTDDAEVKVRLRQFGEPICALLSGAFSDMS